MASGTGILFSFSAILFLSLLLLQAPPAPGLAAADLVVSALDRLLDGRSVLELMATRRNMILLCHAILFLILWDAGVLGAPASHRRSRSPPGEATAAAAAAPAARPHDATRNAVVVWRRRRPRNRAVVAPVHEHDAAGRVVDVECRPAVEAVATWAAPVLTGPPQAAEEAAAVATKQIVLVESPRNELDHHDHGRDAVVQPVEHPKDDRRIIAVADDDTAREQQTAGMEMEMEMELADDRRFEEFIKSQRRQMRQENLQVVSSGYHYHYQAIATCY